MKIDKQHNKSKSKPKVSVIIPCYNHGKYLNEAVDSVLNQTMQDFEIIIVNDGSTDKFTNTLLRNYNKPKTKVIFQKNQGPAAARNAGIKVARGKYILPLDADDKIDKTYLKKAVKILDKNHKIDFVVPWVKFFGTDNWLWETRIPSLNEVLLENHMAISSIFKKSCCRKVGGYDENRSIAEYIDWDLWISFIKRGFKGVVIKEFLFLYRKHGKSFISNADRKHHFLLKYLLKKHGPLFQINAEDLFIKKDVQLKNAYKYISEQKKIAKIKEKYIAELLKAKEWFLGQIKDRERQIKNLEKAKKGYLNQIKNKEDYISELLKAKEWFLGQIKDRELQIKNKDDYIAELLKAKEWFLDQIKDKERQIKEKEN